MSTKKQIRSENIKEKKIKKSTKMFYLSLIVGGGIVLLVVFFVILFSAIFPTDDMEAMKKKDKVIVKMYFSDPQERFLKSEKRFVVKETDQALQAKEIVKALLAGSKNDLVDTFPKGVTVKDVKIEDDGIASVSFSKNLIKSHEGSSASEMATVYSLTNSITQNIPAIKKVKILVEGREISSIKGHISTRKAFAPDWELIVPEN
ncbi:MAG TPA: GerMN domain-containing protein [Smithella sp.]|nr:GerMN domain-containing protein [Smithella sp.]HNY48969.1 GerMN domain-containing protein [Smithella sp.]HOG89053.1 GerMN domain-containing protein [Smithella sp.]HOU49769.1 GerMN domain-containing protein [Smithella sp.]HQI71563.1 GerMN domain-containing protein [Smithella sp.]